MTANDIQILKNSVGRPLIPGSGNTLLCRHNLDKLAQFRP